jgi:membrane fusion protein, multidrug efflux system
MEAQRVLDADIKVQGAPVPVKAPKSKFNLRKLALPVGVLVLGIVSYVSYNSYMYVSTDDATIEGRAILISARVGGIVVESKVKENQKVKKGQLLAQIRPDDYQNALDQAQAQLESAQANMTGAESNYNRALNLFKANAYSKDKVDSAEATYKSYLAQTKGAAAAVSQAKLNLDYTQIVAPADGRVSKKSFEEGTLASPGTPLIGFVYDDERWVIANMKETDMVSLAEGKKAYISVDSLDGKTFEGTVESISPNTGATFSMLPPDNATGNFTKVVQRVPVRIKLLNLSAGDIDRLQTGLSVEASVRVH